MFCERGKNVIFFVKKRAWHASTCQAAPRVEDLLFLKIRQGNPRDMKEGLDPDFHLRSLLRSYPLYVRETQPPSPCFVFAVGLPVLWKKKLMSENIFWHILCHGLVSQSKRIEMHWNRRIPPKCSSWEAPDYCIAIRSGFFGTRLLQ
jgi:hypothetical protein